MQNNRCIHEIVFRQYEEFSDPQLQDRQWDQLSKKEKRKVYEHQSVKDALKRCSEHCGNTVRGK